MTGDAFNPAYTLSGISVGNRSSACLAKIRATSNATFPAPSTATSRASNGHVRGTSGCPSNHDTKSAAPNDPGRSIPSIGNAASRIDPVEKITAS
ncbi:hypothetical protein OJAG_17520 [Oerskovia enterophila]|uniref:Uncharacterized protein n=1 Tax=Oerskovia enterophila TaxID=43678 RepID=A0A165S395_9CELL|nr:hypothetical protein OJAG_17520 [Oerskovia enterophila]OCI29223.1 hypothetical protein OERS_40980 [Oerskovia enterophila]